MKTYLDCYPCFLRQALALRAQRARLKALVAVASDPLDMAVRLSVAGNIIDLPNLKHDLWETVEQTLIQTWLDCTYHVEEHR